jgi:RsiW-degrading membrane proteinase PrsW (M82 family)
MEGADYPPPSPVDSNAEAQTLPAADISQPARRAGGVALLALAAFLSLCGILSGGCYLILPLVEKNRDAALQLNLVTGALAGLSILLAALLAWQAIVTLSGRPSSSAARAFPPVVVFIGLDLLAILFGLGILSSSAGGPSFATAYVFPPWHLIAAALPPLALLAYAAHRLGATSGLRALILSVSWGALGATGLALLLELVTGASIAGIVALALMLLPGNEGVLAQLGQTWEQSQASQDPANLFRLLSNPAIITGVFVYFTFIVPLIEEAVKTLVVAFADPRRMRSGDAVLWGIGAGAGFAILESALNASTVLDAWAVAMILRVGATVMHVGNGATMARGWYAARVERRWSKLIRAYCVCVIFHAVWNAAALSLGGSAIFLSDTTTTMWERLSAGGASLALCVLLGLLTFGGLTRIAAAVRSTRELVQEKT